MSRKIFNIAQIGLGRMGLVHSKILFNHGLVNLKYLADIDLSEDKIVKYQNNVGFPEEYLDRYMDLKSFIKKACSDSSIDGFYICTPTSTHLELIRIFAAFGKPIFCEKPLADDVHEIRESYETANMYKTKLLCGFNKRFDPSYNAFAKLINDGEIGELQTIRFVLSEYPMLPIKNLKRMSNIFTDTMTLDLDFLLSIIKKDPVEVYAHSYQQQKEELKGTKIKDSGFALMRFPNNQIATFDVRRFSNIGYDQRIEAIGVNGNVNLENIPHTSVKMNSASGSRLKQLYPGFQFRYDDSYINELNHFLELIKHKDKKPLITEEDVYRATKIVQLCRHAAKTKTVMNVNDYDI